MVGVECWCKCVWVEVVFGVVIFDDGVIVWGVDGVEVWFEYGLEVIVYGFG